MGLRDVVDEQPRRRRKSLAVRIGSIAYFCSSNVCICCILFFSFLFPSIHSFLLAVINCYYSDFDSPSLPPPLFFFFF